MHFSLHDETVRMIPDWIPFKPTIATVTGMIEVATGILLLVPQARRWAALVSLILLVAYIPAVYHILNSDQALTGSAFFQTAFRIALMPNNILLGICSVHLLQNPGASLTAPPPSEEKASSRLSLGDLDLSILLVAGLLLMANCAGFIAIFTGLSGHYGLASLWAMMCIAIGALLGFLFAVPRVNPAVKASSALVTNTNIEQVSDWLTKILIGVGLINLKQIGVFIDELSSDLASSLGTGTAPVGKPFALSLIVYFFVVGLIQGYLLTRLFLSRQFALQIHDPDRNPYQG